MAVLHRISGNLDHSALRRSIRLVVERHDILRTRFDEHEGVPFQTIAATPPDVLAVDDLTGLGAGQAEEAAKAAAGTEAATPFDLAAGPLYRFRLFRLADSDHLLSIVIHHIVCDGWSISLLCEELSAAYEATVTDQPVPLGTPPVRYRDFVDAQRREQRDGTFDAQLDYWAQRLAGIPTLELPADHPRPALAGHRGEQLRVKYPEAFRAALNDVAKGQGCSLSMLVTAAFGVVLSRYTGESDIAVGTTALGRLEPEWERLVGLFVNVVVLRMDSSGDPTFAQFLERVRDTTLDAYDNQTVPFERVVDRVGVARDASRNPLFQVLIQVLDEITGSGSLQLPGTAVSPVELPITRSRFDLALTFAESARGLELMAEYSTELFDRWRMEQLLSHVERVLAAVAADPSVRLSAIDLLSAQDRTDLLDMGCGSTDPLRLEPAHVLVAEHAAAAPESVAVVFDGAEVTYGELCRRAEVLAGHLRRTLGVAHEEPVAVALDRGVDVVTAFLGVSKAGGAYVVLDIDHPVNRLEFILDDASARVVLTTSDLLVGLPEPGSRTYVLLDRDWADIEAGQAGAAPLPEVSTGDSLVNVLYTSGTTGRPKGVLTEHRALASYLAPFVRTYGLGPGDRVLQFANLAFDLCQAEIFATLTSGATLVCARKDVLHTPEALAALVREQRITYLGAPPTMLAMLEPEPYPDLRHIFVGGEACPAEIANRWNLPGRLFINGYGPTEAAIGVTMHPVPRIRYRSSPPIGGPLPHRRLYVVDPETLALMPVGVPGELLIGGDGVLARGYLERPDLTEEKFVPDPFRSDGKVYRTGDLARWNSEGHLEFLGRIDTQVKLRGLRIELEEIETVLMTHAAVRQAAVTLTDDSRGQKILAAYYTLAEDAEPSILELRRHIGEYVPAYMVPSAWTVLDALPLSSTGKLSRKALPAPASYVDAGREVVTPRTLTERHVAAAFAEVLGLPAGQVGLDDDFFELGGSSLQAMRVISRVNRAFAARLGVRSLYGASNLRDFAQQVEAASTVTPEAPDDADRPAPPGSAEHIAAIFAEVLAGAVRPGDNLFALGGGEAQAATVLELIGERAGVRLTERDLYVPSVLAAAVEARRSALRWSPLVTLAAGPGRFPPLFCLPGASGTAATYAGLARRMTTDRPVIALETPGLEAGSDPRSSIEDLAGELVAAVRAHQPDGPYHLLGWSMGGLVAFDMARQLHASGAAVAFLALVDTARPTGEFIPDERHLVERFVTELAAQAGGRPPDLGAVFGDGPGEPADRLFALLRGAFLPEDLEPDQFRRRLAVYQASAGAAFNYRPAWVFPGRLDVLRAAEGAAVSAAEWSGLAAEVREYRSPGSHYTMWSAENRPILAAVLDTLLATVES